MLTKDLEYNLPEERIAIYPPEERGSTRLMVIDRSSGEITHDKYSNLVAYLNIGDVLVLNNTKVMKSRLFFKSGEKTHEVLFLSKECNSWECLISHSKKLKKGDLLDLRDQPNVTIRISEKLDDSVWVVETATNVEMLFDLYGHVPIPPYMKRDDIEEDELRYNTIFGLYKGSSAAPTASLNFTHSLLDQIRDKGVIRADVTLDVGWGTFSPIRGEVVEDHKIHKEKIYIGQADAMIIDHARSRKGRILAAGTTAARTLESVATLGSDKVLQEYSGETELYIYPGYNWKVVDMLLTNFHAPRTSLLAMIASFMGVELMQRSYETAIREEYEFLSYGDSMLIV